MDSSFAAYATFLLAKALKDYFPKIQLVGGFSQNSHFSYDFIADFPVDDQALKFLNDRIKELINTGIQVSSHEMLQGVALSMFTASKERVWVSMLKEMDRGELASLVRVGDLYCLDSKHEFSAPMKGFVKLISAKKEEIYLPKYGATSVWRISGLAENDSLDFKEKVKQTKGAESHEVIGEKLGLFQKCKEEMIYTGKGASFFRRMEGLCAEAYESQNFEFIKVPSYSEGESQVEDGFTCSLWDHLPYNLSGNRLKWHLSHFKKTKIGQMPVLRSAEVSVFYRRIPSRDARGLWLSKSYHRDESYCLVPYKSCREALISSLHFIQKNANISGIESLWFPTLPKLGKLSMSFEALMQNEEIFKIELKKGKVSPKKFALFYADAFMESWEGPTVELMNIPDPVGREIKVLTGWQDEIFLIKTSLYGSFERFLAFCLEKNKALP